MAHLAAYADHWGWYVVNAQEHQGILSMTHHYAAATLVQIDWHKTWMWATTTAPTPVLKRVAAMLFDAPSLHTVLIQGDLGCQLTYCGPPRLGKQKSRFQAAKNPFKKLASIRADIKDKASLALNGAYAVA